MHSFALAEVMSFSFLEQLSRTYQDIGDGGATIPGTPEEKLKTMVSLSSSPSANRARHKRPQTPPAAHTAEQTSDDDEGQPAKRSRDDEEEEQLQIPATQEIVAQAPAATGRSSGSKGVVPTAKYGGKGRGKAGQLSRTPTKSMPNRLTRKQPEPAEGEERITPQKVFKAAGALKHKIVKKCSKATANNIAPARKQSQAVRVATSAAETRAEPKCTNTVAREQPPADDAEETVVQPSRNRKAAAAFECEQGVNDTSRRIEAIEAAEAALCSESEHDRTAAAQMLSDGMAEGWFMAGLSHM